ncbi:hypothetical protein AVEN_202594-1 [Araneus ventricosus]|uniref:Uncharacterized protein n=1 Tax=Araneus ventricosus TaxID=182803 RepID=A0A4Y2QMV1_ARAVE|nr:hypothetical protein AVEN_202594-1 [Araneus ventricosus]
MCFQSCSARYLAWCQLHCSHAFLLCFPFPVLLSAFDCAAADSDSYYFSLILRFCIVLSNCFSALSIFRLSPAFLCIFSLVVSSGTSCGYCLIPQCSHSFLYVSSPLGSRFALLVVDSQCSHCFLLYFQ